MPLRYGFHISRAGESGEDTTGFRESDATGFYKTWGISRDSAGATGLHMCRTFFPPGAISEAHFHPDSQTGIYVLSGHALVNIGEDQAGFEVGPGDFVYIGSGIIHRAENQSATEPYEAILVRDTDNEIVVAWRPELLERRQ